MNDYDIIITIGSQGDNEDMALDNVRDILFYIQSELVMDNYSIVVEKRGEWVE